MFAKYALTDPFHNASYAGISPERPELSQSGKTVVVTGGNSGIGYGAAQGFVAASASRVVVLGRRPGVVVSAAQKLAREAGPAFRGEVVGLPCDITDAAAVDALWDKFRADGVVVDVLVLNAAGFAPLKPLLEVGTEGVWKTYDANVRAQLQMTERFYKQEGKGASDTKVSSRLCPVSVLSLSQRLVFPLLSLNLEPRSHAPIAEPSPRLHRLDPRVRRLRGGIPLVRLDQARRSADAPARSPGHPAGEDADRQLPPGRHLHRSRQGHRLDRGLYPVGQWYVVLRQIFSVTCLALGRLSLGKATVRRRLT